MTITEPDVYIRVRVGKFAKTSHTTSVYKGRAIIDDIKHFSLTVSWFLLGLNSLVHIWNQRLLKVLSTPWRTFGSITGFYIEPLTCLMGSLSSWKPFCGFRSIKGCPYTRHVGNLSASFPLHQWSKIGSFTCMKSENQIKIWTLPLPISIKNNICVIQLIPLDHVIATGIKSFLIFYFFSDFTQTRGSVQRGTNRLDCGGECACAPDCWAQRHASLWHYQGQSIVNKPPKYYFQPTCFISL